MRKFIISFAVCLFSVGIAFAGSGKSNVYISANVSQSFGTFKYDAFVNDFMTQGSSSGEKTFDGPRYDFEAGYRFGSKIRTELQYIIISKNSFETSMANSNVEYKASAIFANVIYDFWDVQDSLFTPFIGIGAGLGSESLKLGIVDLRNERDQNGFSWQVQGGVNIKLLDWLLVNAKYSYLALPGIENSIKGSYSGLQTRLEREFNKGVQTIGIGVTLLL